MAENHGSLEGVLDANETLEGEIDSHDEMSGEIQSGGGANGVRDVQVNNESVVDANKVAHINLTPYAEKEDVYDKDAVDTLLEGKADTSDIPTALSQLENDDNYVQDADYVHTDNNFTDEDKAAIGGIPENITDLSDVEVSNIQNGQVLKWDSNQNKFVNANESGGGSGDVADVKVNGTSVVDPVTKEANIDLTGYAETSDIPTDLADLSDDSTHRLVTDTEKAGWDAKADTSDIPTVNNNTIIIQKNGQNVDTFSLNQTTDKVINITVPTKTSDLQNDSSFITNTVNNLANYYLKSQTYTQTEVNNLISAAVNGRFEKVTVLPASGEPNVIYLVPKTTALTNNVYDEYIWQDNAWELLGSTEIDLSNYVTTTDLATALADYVTSSTFNTTIANYYTKTEVGNLLDEKVDKVSGKGLSTYDYDATAKGIVDNVTTNLAGKVDKVNGKGLSTNDYTTNEKNKLAGISTGANKVESSTTNGNIKIDGVETQVYDESDIQDKIDTSLTSVSGNPLSISGLKSDQLAVNPIITFEPIQAGSGTPSPSNIRAISGYDKIEVLSCGKNLVDGRLTGYAINTNGTFASNVNYDMVYAPVVKGASYVISSDNNAVMGWYMDKPTTTSQAYDATRYNYTVGTAVTAPITGWVAFRTAANYASPQVEYGSTQTTYQVPHKTTDISESLGQTVYGGSLDVRTGKFTVDRAIYKVNASDITFNSSNYIITTSATSFKAISTDDVQNYISTHLKSHINSNVMTMDNEFTINNNKQIVIKMPNTITTDTQATNYFTNKDVYICGLLITPIEIQLTPHEISLLSQYAYVSTNGSLITLDYHNGEMASLADVSQLGETVNELGEYVGANIKANEENLLTHTISTPYEFPCDGYVIVYSGTATSGKIDLSLRSADNQNFGGINIEVARMNQMQTTFVKKGMKAFLSQNTVPSGNTNVIVVFRGLKS